jgi:hypothetical protein
MLLQKLTLAALLLALPAAASADVIATTLYPNAVSQVTLALGVDITPTNSDITIGGNASGAALYSFSLSGVPAGATITQVNLNYQIKDPLIEGTADFGGYVGDMTAININDGVAVGYGTVTSGGESLTLDTGIFNDAIGGTASILGYPDDPLSGSLFYLSANPSLDVTYSTPSVPEPASLGLLSLGAIAFLRRRSR